MAMGRTDKEHQIGMNGAHRIVLVCVGAVLFSAVACHAAAEADPLSVLLSGNPVEAAEALAEVVPDAGHLENGYGGLISAAERATGTIDLSTLHGACVGYHRWVADLIADTDRARAIIE